MATKASRPGRTLIVFGLVIAALYGGVALGGVWKPKLGLDLQGGTRITLEASTSSGEAVTPEKLQEARGIIEQRVNGSGVTEAEVSTQGDRNIIVEIPGQNASKLVDRVKQTAQLRFRLVAAEAYGRPQPKQKATPSPSGSPSPSSSPADGASPAAKPSGQAKASEGASPRGRAVSRGLVRADQPSAKPSKKPKADGSASPSATPAPSPSAAPQPPATSQKGAPVSEPLQWMDNPGETWLKKFAAFKCPPPGKSGAPVADDPDQPLITCDDRGIKYLLSTAMIQGTQLTDASAGIPQNQVQWVVNLSFDSSARKTFADVTSQIANQTSPITGQQKQFAIVLDGKVISAPTVNSPIPNGQAEISGNFTQTEAQTLANSLKYGALPLKFTAPVVTEEGPSLAADQLSAGLWAGVVGLILVMAYCLFYYRGLGLVVITSLVVAALITYAMVVLMSSAIAFTLTLPGIAGLIVAVGITADSFIVYFERIRDEMREGRSMRVAVEAGWKRARNTCLAADAVSLLAAIVLYIFAVGVVKGFAFALGISTVIDLVVFFLFTKPMVSWLAQFTFFNSGHKMSGLSPEHIGIDKIAGARPRTAGGKA
ncbi:MAG TPA: protein translocase subunit SecD [Nocardioidaceae bacterium]